MILIGHKNGNIEKTSISSNTQIIKGYPTHTVIGGEFAIVNEENNIALKTLLGSCVAIMFYDNIKKIYSMNHFLLPKTNSANDDMKYGLFSVESMLNEMYKLGCKKQNIEAKISGGASMVSFNNNNLNTIGNRNVEFAIDFCNAEGFKIISNHTRGTKSRLILLTENFQTFIKNIDSSNENSDIINNEINLQNEIILNKATIESSDDSIELF